MTKTVTSVAHREVWCVEIRTDTTPQDDTPNSPWLEVNAEYVERWPDGNRVIRQALPAMRTELYNLDKHPVVMRDGHKTTMANLVEALLREAESAVDGLEKTDHQGRTQCLMACMRKFNTPRPRGV